MNRSSLALLAGGPLAVAAAVVVTGAVIQPSEPDLGPNVVISLISPTTGSIGMTSVAASDAGAVAAGSGSTTPSSSDRLSGSSSLSELVSPPVPDTTPAEPASSVFETWGADPVIPPSACPAGVGDDDADQDDDEPDSDSCGD